MPRIIFDQLGAMRVFVRIADSGSFAKAAASMNLPRSTVSKLLQDLEKHLGVKLAERSTRALAITPKGLAYRDRALALLADLDEMDSVALAGPRGRLRVDVGSSLANHVLIPALPDFRRRYPDIQLLLGVSDRPVDLIGEGVDCLIRGGGMADTSLVARRLCAVDYVTCAAPDYLSNHGTPSHPMQIQKGHATVGYLLSQSGKSLPMQFNKADQFHEIDVSASTLVSESSAHTAALLAGLGIGQIFGFSARPHLASGRLVSLFQDWQQPSHPLHLVYPATRHPSAKLRAFIDWAVELFSRKDCHIT